MPVADVVDLKAVLMRGHALLQANKDRSMQSTTGDSRRDRQHWVFERSRCLRCGTRVSTALQDSDGSPVPPHARPPVGAARSPQQTSLRSTGSVEPPVTGAGRGRERVTYWCPRCQPGPAPTSYPVRVLLGAPTVGRTRYAP